MRERKKKDKERKRKQGRKGPRMNEQTFSEYTIFKTV